MKDLDSSRRFRALHCGVSLCALAVMGFAPAAHAQTAASDAPAQQESGAEAQAGEDGGQTIVVVGVRRALDTSQNIKKNSDTFVDSITATDIGAFPDKSAAEALARVPGITVNRLQSADDSTHPSGEPTGVLIRGLPQVRTEFNGRDTSWCHCAALRSDCCNASVCVDLRKFAVEASGIFA